LESAPRREAGVLPDHRDRFRGPTTTCAPLRSALSEVRLKLAGAIVLKEAVGSCPVGYGTSSTARSAGGPVARSLSAIR